MAKSATKKVMQLKISLNDSKPKVWRRIVVSADYSFFDLHCAIQDTFGWGDFHLHGFYISQKGTARPIMLKFPEPEGSGFDFFDKEEDLDERDKKISDYLPEQVKQFQYTYDFGDSWDHTILFEKECEANPKIKYPICLAGAGDCQPEDCDKVLDQNIFDPADVVFEDPKVCREYWESGDRF